MDPIQTGIDDSTPSELVQALSEALRSSYVLPSIAEEMCTSLQRRLDDGEYSDILDGELLALALTLHMQEVSKDEHLWVRWHPEPLPAHDGPLRENQEWLEARRLEAELDNYGFHKVERLSGNIGYVDIRRFHRAEWGGDTAVAAMNFLANASALIIDLRRCTGGSPGMVALVSSFLFGAEPVHLNDMYWRDEDTTQQFWTLPHVPGRRSEDKPLYLLTSRDTFSGGEALAYHLQSRQRATVVGERTDGGAHAGSSHRLHRHFEAFIACGRAIDPVTKSNWQGSGVTPDVQVRSEQALECAHRLALESVIESASSAASGPHHLVLAEARAFLEAMRSPEP